MQQPFKAASPWRLVLSILIPLFIFSCENPGSVGGDLIPEVEIFYDTLAVTGFTPETDAFFSGNLTNLSFGEFSDPLFGDIRTVSYIKPEIDFPLTSVVDETFSLQLELSIDTTAIYGDTLSTANFTIYEVSELWRGNELTSESDISYDISLPLAQFSVLKENTILIDMPAEWTSRYASYVNDTTEAVDSLYAADFYGFAIVPDAGLTKIVFPETINSRFILIEDVDVDTTYIGFQDWGFDVNRNNAPVLTSGMTLHNTFESYYSFNLMDIAQAYKETNILGAELQFTIDKVQLDNSLNADQSRLRAPFIEIKYDLGSDKLYDLQFRSANLLGFINEDESVFTIDITRVMDLFVYEDMDPSTTFYLHINPGGGLLRSTLLFDESEAIDKAPVLIISKAVN